MGENDLGNLKYQNLNTLILKYHLTEIAEFRDISAALHAAHIVNLAIKVLKMKLVILIKTS